MNEKHLKPLRERLWWITKFFACITGLLILEIYLIDTFDLMINLEYILKGRDIWFVLIFIVITLLSWILNYCLSLMSEHFSKNGDYLDGDIVRVVWKRSYISGYEWKIQFIIKCNDKLYYSYYYGYEILNYMTDTWCKVYLYKNKCHIDELRTCERDITKEEKRNGIYGGKKSYNTIPDFPICKSLMTIKRFSNKSGKNISSRAFIGLICILISMYATKTALSLPRIQNRDTDNDGVMDLFEFRYGSDPLKYNETFTYKNTAESGCAKIMIEVTTKTGYLLEYETKILTDVSEHNENMQGYIINPFKLYFSKNVINARLLIEFDEKLLLDEEFLPCLYRYSRQNAIYGMEELNCEWDGSSNKLYYELSNEDISMCDWNKYYFLNKAEREQLNDKSNPDIVSTKFDINLSKTAKELY